MKFASFKINGAPSWGLIDGAEAVDLGALLRDRFVDLKSAIAAGALGEAAAAAGKAARHRLAAVTWLPVIPNPDKILCIGLNYETHRKETGRTEVENPTVFGRFANSQTGHLANIIRPKVSKDLDFEGELALIIGKSGRYISRAQTRGTTLRDTPATMKAASATISATPINSRRARTSRRPARSVPGW
jgi:2-keto-4-pentenoate hydratase/2-oxohepta-3-ene-1,7-dioic acid hydratase in catechol pathway